MATRTFDRKQEIAAAAAHLGITDYAVKELAVMAAPLYADTFDHLLELLSQPDPCKDLAVVLLIKHRDKHLKFRQLAEWITNAKDCYHAAETVIYEHYPKGSDLTNQVVEGVHHYRGTGTKYSTDNVVDFARITAAALLNSIKPEQAEGYSDIYTRSCISTRNCAHLNQNLMQIAAASHETANKMVDLILANGIAMESQLMHLLNNAPRALMNGAL